MDNFLNKKQLEAVKQTEGELLIVAGAGSGKTRVVTSKIVYLIFQKQVDPQLICAITFTRKAAQEMKDRIQKHLNKFSLWNLTISTYHSLCLKILRSDFVNKYYRKDFQILSEFDSKNMLKKIVKELFGIGISNSEPGFFKEKMNIVSKKINSWKKANVHYSEINFSNLLELDEINAAKSYKLYEKLKEKHNSLDFQDLIFWTNRLFQNKSIKNKWASRFKYVLIDEIQDTSDDQYQLIEHISSYYHNLTLVGDPDQTIYAWRGANPTYILNFKKIYPKGKIIILNINYRSSKEILDLSNDYIKKNQNRYKKILSSPLKNIKESSQPEILGFVSLKSQANFIADKINNFIKTKKYDYNDFLVLYRQNNNSKNIEDSLRTNKIPYEVTKGYKFWNRQEIVNILNILKMLLSDNNTLYFQNLCLSIKGLGPKTFENILNNIDIENIKESFKINYNKMSKNQLLSKLNVLFKFFEQSDENISITNFVKQCLELLGFTKNNKSINYNEIRYLNILELYNHFDNFERKYLGMTKSIKARVADFLEELYIEPIENTSELNNVVRLSTIHKAKGLESRCVFVVGFDISWQSILKIEENRRLFYVALTRAKEKLWITFLTDHKNYWNDSNNLALNKIPNINNSMLLKELNPNLYNYNISESEDYLNKEEKFNVYKKRIDYSSYLKTFKHNWKVNDILDHDFFGRGQIINIIQNKLLQVKFQNKDINTKFIKISDQNRIFKKTKI